MLSVCPLSSALALLVREESFLSKLTVVIVWNFNWLSVIALLSVICLLLAPKSVFTPNL